MDHADAERAVRSLDRLVGTWSGLRVDDDARCGPIDMTVAALPRRCTIALALAGPTNRQGMT